MTWERGSNWRSLKARQEQKGAKLPVHGPWAQGAQPGHQLPSQTAFLEKMPSLETS